jgi:hypothetical protein
MPDTKWSALTSTALNPATDALVGLRSGVAYRLTAGALAGLNSVSESNLSFTDITTGNASTTQHGLLPKLNNNSATFLDGTGNWTTPAGGGGGGSGTVNSGTVGALAYYAAATTTVGPFSGIVMNPTQAASTPLMQTTATPFSGGSTTTTFPMMFWQPTGATAAAWSTGGTFIGINAASGFTGNFIDCRLNGATASGAAFSVSNNGNAVFGGSITGVGITASGSITTTAASGFRHGVAATVLAGTTSGNLRHTQPFQGTSFKKWVGNAQAYVNNTTTAQTVTFPVAFTYTPSVTFNDTGLTVTVSTTTLTITAPNSLTAFTGNITVEGF